MNMPTTPPVDERPAAERAHGQARDRVVHSGTQDRTVPVDTDVDRDQDRDLDRDSDRDGVDDRDEAMAQERQLHRRPVDEAAMGERSADERPLDEPVQADEPAGMLPGEEAAVPMPRMWSGDDARGLRDRLRETQLRFLDDPRGAVEQVEALVGEAMESFTSRLAHQREELTSWRSAGADDTEQLRVVAQRYRDFLERLLSL